MYKKEKYLIRSAINKAVLPRGNYFIAGGACTSVFSNKSINDLDIYFRSEEDLNYMINNVMTETDSDGSYLYTLLGETQNALTYKRGDSLIQLIKKYFLPPEQLIEKYDFTMCQCAYDVTEDKFIMGKDFLYDLAKRNLRFTGNTEYPIASLYRMKKFLSRGFTISAIDIIALALSINNLHIETFKGLKEQLDGIDTMLLKDITDAFLERGDNRYEMSEVLTFMNIKLEEKYEKEQVKESNENGQG